MGWSDVIQDCKAYLSIRFKNKKRFPQSKVESYVHKHINIGRHCTVKKSVLFSESLKRIGHGTYIGDGAKLFNCSEIGNYSSISHDVKIGLDDHILDSISTSPLLYNRSNKHSPTVIGNDVLISANVSILSGVTIGTGAVIGANSFVNEDIPPYAIYAGTPAKLIKYRFEDDQIKRLLESNWWDTDHEKLVAIIRENSSLENILESIEKLNA